MKQDQLTYFRLAQLILENGLEIKEMEKELKLGLMEQNMRESGEKIKPKAMGNFGMLMEIYVTY